ncbi:MAG TPA: peptide-methionine (S)-S-oxide reductase MsrA [Longimicrobiales bacterium]|nr:peptide-methionine (S)-S-oxide reductase MsrA [Longimicrobiales bacterium]
MSRETATLGGGCFWCLEAAYERLRGVEEVVSGYAGGEVENPTYRQVCGGATGHAEVVRVTFDSDVIPFREILEVFFTIHDPTTKDRQGADVGPQYRSIILYESDEQKRIAAERIAELERAGTWRGIVTEVEPLERFWPAEPVHQRYYERNSGQAYCQVVIAPKLEKLRKGYAEKLKG